MVSTQVEKLDRVLSVSVTYISAADADSLHKEITEIYYPRAEENFNHGGAYDIQPSTHEHDLSPDMHCTMPRMWDAGIP